MENDKFLKVFNEVVTTGKVAASVIDSYESFIRNDIKEIMKISKIHIADDQYVGFVGEPYYELPEDNPNKERIRRGNYLAKLHYDMALFQIKYTDKKTVIEPITNSIGRVRICSIPVMVGSSLDIARTLSQQQRLEIGEPPNDPGGYFIMEGAEKVLMMQEGIKPRYPAIFKTKAFPHKERREKEIEIIYTSGESGSGLASSVFILLMSAKTKVLQRELTTPREGTKDTSYVNILHIFYVLVDRLFPNIERFQETRRKYLNSLDNFVKYVTNLVSRFIVDKDPVIQNRRRKSARDIISLTAAPLRSEESDEKSDIPGLINTFGRTYDHFRHILSMNKKSSNKEVSSKVIDDIFKNTSFLPQKDILRAKLRTLSYVTAKFIDALGDYRGPESRDDWGIKRIVTAGEHMRSNFATTWSKIISTITDSAHQGNKNFQGIMANIQSSGRLIDESYISAFKSQGWRSRAGSKGTEQTIVDTFARQNIIDSLSHLSRIRTPGSTKGSIDKRLMQPTQYGYGCPVTTPEGQTCGLIKDHTIMARVTSENSPDDVKSFLYSLDLSKDIYKEDSEEEKMAKLLFYNRPGKEHIELENKYGYASVFINGINVGFTIGNYGGDLKDLLVQKRREERIRYDTAIILTDMNEIWIYTDGGRLVRPVMPVNTNTGKHIIDEVNGWEFSYPKMRKTGCIEYIDSKEIQHYFIMDSPHKLDQFNHLLSTANKFINEVNPAVGKTTNNIVQIIKNMPMNTEMSRKQRYVLFKLKELFRTYSNISYPEYTEIDQSAILGAVPCIGIPFTSNSTGPRISYHANMCKQGLSIDNVNMDPKHGKLPRSAMKLKEADVPLVHNTMTTTLGLDDIPNGRMVMCAFMVYESSNMEDAIIVNEKSIHNGIFQSEHYFSYSTEALSSNAIIERFGVPVDLPEHIRKKFAHIDSKTGLPAIGTFLRSSDPIIAKFSHNGQKYIDKSVYVKLMEQGEVDYAEMIKAAGSNTTMANVRLKNTRAPEPGDKFVTAPSQKGVIGEIVPYENIPYVVTEDENDPMNGVRPAVIFNPHGIITRVTVGKIYELCCGLIGLKKGKRIVSDPLRRIDVKKLKDMMLDCGFSTGGTFKMFNPNSGKVMKNEIMVGPVYYNALKQFIYTVSRARGSGPVDPIHRQPRRGNAISRGKAIAGAQRLGYMSVNALSAYGASSIIVERSVKSSDEFPSTYCACGIRAIVNKETAEIRCPICSDEKESNAMYNVVIPYSIIEISLMMNALGIDFRMIVDKQENK